MDETEAVRELLREAEYSRDQLPYTDEFARLKREFEVRARRRVTNAQFWRLLVHVGKRGGLARSKSRKNKVAASKLTTAQQLELLRLLPDGIGNRDQLPYTREFDSLHRRFSELTGTNSSKNEFWRIVSRIGKWSRKPRRESRKSTKAHARSAAPPIRVGIVGTGVGVRTHLPAFLAHPGVQVTMLCGQDAAKTKRIAREYKIPAFAQDYRELCQSPEVDLVCVATPPYLHREMAVAAISAGKHLLCEKPLGLDASDAEAIVSASRAATSRHHLVDLQLRFHEDLVLMRKLLFSARIGQPYYVRVNQESSDFLKPESDWKWWFERDRGGGLLLAMGPHLVDLIHHWFGPCAHVQAQTHVLPDLWIQNGSKRRIEVEAAFCATLTMQSGVTVVMTCTAAGCVSKKKLQISIFGDGGELHFDTSAGVTLIERGRQPDRLSPFRESYESSNGSVFRTGFQHFVTVVVRALQDKYLSVPNAATVEDGLKTQRVLEAIRLSADTYKTVELSEVMPPPTHSGRKQVQLAFSFRTERSEFYIADQRAMVSVGPYTRNRACPYSCAFCYVPVGFSTYPKRQVEEVARELAWRRYATQFDRVYISGDTESFYKDRNGVGLLEALTPLGVDLLFTTRSELSPVDLARIREVVDIQRASGHRVFGCVSIPRLESHPFLEPPPIPSPGRRIEVLKALSEVGCIAVLAVRPFLPIIPIEEYCKIIAQCVSFADCVLGEAWYVDTQGKLEARILGKGNTLPIAECREISMDFDSNSLKWKVWEAPNVRKAVARCCSTHSLPFFMRSHKAIEYFRANQPRRKGLA